MAVPVSQSPLATSNMIMPQGGAVPGVPATSGPASGPVRTPVVPAMQGAAPGTPGAPMPTPYAAPNAYAQQTPPMGAPAPNPYGPQAAPNPYAAQPNPYAQQPYNQGQNQAYNQLSQAANSAAGWAVGAVNAIGNAFEQAVNPPPPRPYGVQPGYGAQPGHAQQPGYGAQPGYAPGAQPYGAPPAAFGPGARVYVRWADGNRYPATVMQAAGAQCLVAFQDGQQRWVDAQYLSPGM